MSDGYRDDEEEDDFMSEEEEDEGYNGNGRTHVHRHHDEDEEDEDDDDEDDYDHENDGDYEEEEEDEQKSQLFNGKIEVLQQEVSNLRLALQNEKTSHETTKASLKDAESQVLSAVTALEERKSSSSSFVDGNTLQKELQSFLIAHAIEVEGINFDTDFHLEQYRQILHAISSKIVDGSKRKSIALGLKTTTVMNDSELSQRVSHLEEELKMALGASEDIRALKCKLVSMVERTRIEKEMKLKADSDAMLLRKTIKMLSDHIEKLMNHLKHEASAKIRILEKQRVVERKSHELEESIVTLSKKNSAKDRLILELREGSKILEDQLRLMDEKFLELRSKLDFARESEEKKNKRAAKEAAELRAKIALLHLGNKLQSTVCLPNIYEGGSGGGISALNGFTNEDTFEGEGSRRGNDSALKTRKKNKKKKEEVVSIDAVIDKLRKQREGKSEWTEERARDLLAGSHSKGRKV